MRKTATTRLMLVSLVISFLSPLTTRAQSVPIKSVPVAEGDQFLLFPSERAGMGGVGIALGDRLHDLFVNPSKAVRLDGLHFISSPVYYGFGPLNGTPNEGSGRTLPVGILGERDGIFGGISMAYQELVSSRAQNCCIGGWTNRQQSRESAISINNLYLFGLGGLEIPGTDWALGVSTFHGRLGGMEGVSLLYASNDVRQDGGMQQYRAGIHREWGAGHSAELVLMHHRFDMRHEMEEFVDGERTTRTERDRTQSIAMQTGYRHTFDTGWSLGARIVGDWKWHPKIPNYDLMQIPRDPGNSAAYNVGIGISTTSGGATFAADFIFEPIWSHTWAEAIEPTETARETTIPVGGKTVDNKFVFDNARVSMGMHYAGERMDFALGLDMHHISYDLDQMDFVDDERRLLDQHWTEWTFSGGLGKEFSGFRLQYTGRMTLGTGTPSVQAPWQGGWGVIDDRAFAVDASADWVVAPTGPLMLDETIVLSHQVAIVIPLVN